MRKEEFFDKLEYMLQDTRTRTGRMPWIITGITWLRPGAAMRRRPSRISGALNGWRPLSGPTWQAI